MKKFIINSIIFSFLLLCINWLFYFIVWKNYYKDYWAINTNYEVYILADSHGGPLGDRMEKNGVFNFSGDSDSYNDMLRKTRYLINNSNARRIIISVDDHTLSLYRERTNNLDRSVVFATPADFGHYWDFINDKYVKRYIMYFNSKSSAIVRAVIKSKISKATDKKEFKTKAWVELNEKEKLNYAIQRASYQFPDERVSETLVSSLEEIINLCKLNQIELIGIKFPLSYDYYSVIEDKSFQADKVLLTGGLQVMDFKTIYKDFDEYFRDADHLNLIGGNKFCDTLLKSICK